MTPIHLLMALLARLFRTPETIPLLITLKGVFIQAFTYFLPNRTSERPLTIRPGHCINSLSLPNNIDFSQLNYNSCHSCPSWLKLSKNDNRHFQTKNQMYQVHVFIDNKPNFLDAPMNANKALIKDYEKYRVFRYARNKPKQTQPNPFAL